MLPTSSVLTIHSDTTIREAVKALSAHNFSCAPVVDAAKLGHPEISWQDKYLGIVDTVGLVMYMSVPPPMLVNCRHCRSHQD